MFGLKVLEGRMETMTIDTRTEEQPGEEVSGAEGASLTILVVVDVERRLAGQREDRLVVCRFGQMLQHRCDADEEEYACRSLGPFLVGKAGDGNVNWSDWHRAIWGWLQDVAADSAVEWGSLVHRFVRDCGNEAAIDEIVQTTGGLSSRGVDNLLQRCHWWWELCERLSRVLRVDRESRPRWIVSLLERPITICRPPHV